MRLTAPTWMRKMLVEPEPNESAMARMKEHLVREQGPRRPRNGMLVTLFRLDFSKMYGTRTQSLGLNEKSVAAGSFQKGRLGFFSLMAMRRER